MSMIYPHDTVQAVIHRIEAMGEPARDYDVLGMVDSIIQSGGAAHDVDELEFLRLLARHVLEDQTEAACPDWCTREHGHPFETNLDDGRQLRPHEAKLPKPDVGADVYLSLVREDEREKGDDSTCLPMDPVVSFAVDGSFGSRELRQLAAALLNAADRLDEVTGDDRWTEDKL